MRVIAFVACVALALASQGAAQSARDLERIQKQRDEFAAKKAVKGELNAANLKVGARGGPFFIDARVLQVVDEGSMIVEIRDSRTAGARETVMVKCPTDGVVDGKTWRGLNQWKEIVGSPVIEVTGTTTYRTVAGSTKTVFVLEPARSAATVPAVDDRPIEKRVIGRWKLIDAKGETAAYVTINKGLANRDHAPKLPGKWELVKGEVRITWPDGFRDVLRIDDGKLVYVDLGRDAAWTAEPKQILRTVRVK